MLRIPLYYSILTLLLLLLPPCFSWPVMAADLGNNRKQQTTQQVSFHSPQPNISIPFTDPWLHRLEQLYKTFGQQQGMQRLMQDQQCAYSLPDFDCEPYDYDDGLEEDRDAYHLRPQDIQLMISLGDSITAGFGMMSRRPPFASVWEYRGKVFSIGGDLDEEYTLPTFWSSFSTVSGPSHGVTLPLSRGKQLNNAVSGAKAQDLDLQVTRLIRQLGKPDYIKNKDAWKVITLFIGANNVCVLCTPPITQLPGMADVDVFETHVRSAVERLRNEVGHAFVNLVALFNVSSVYDAARGNPYCEMVLDPSHMVVCSCLQADERSRIAADLVVKGYNERLELIAQDYQKLHDPQFAVSYQPGFKFFPVGKYKQRYLSGIDCFHPNRCANQVMAMVLWNNIFSSQEEKNQPYHVQNLTFTCPGVQRPYLRFQSMFRHRISSPITEEYNSSFQSGKASIIGMRKSDSMDAPPPQQQHPSPYPEYEQQQNEYQYQRQYGENLHRPTLPTSDMDRSHSSSTRQEEPLTIESMSAVIAAAVQMSGTTGVKSSLSMGHASIKQLEKKKQQEEKGKRRFSIFTWKRQQQQQQQQQEQQQQQQEEDAAMDSRVDSSFSLSSSASSTTSSPRSSSSAMANGSSGSDSVVTTPVDDGLDELAYRGIQIKEIKTTLKPMVIPSNVTNPMPTVKLERPGFARINY